MKSDKTKERLNKRIALNLIDNKRPIGLNSVKTSAQLTDEHENMKWFICRQLAKENKDYITECYFLNNKRADIVVPGDLKIIEVLSSEEEKQCILKTKMYPKEFEIVMVKANQDWNEKLIY